MRIYGSSPLYNYVELIFRCKRMFILAILLGTIVTGALVYSRSESYEASIIIALYRDVKLASDMSRESNREMLGDSKRKAENMVLWLQNDPDFLPNILKNAGLDQKYPGQKLDDVVRKVRKAIGTPDLISEQYLRVTMRWSNPDEAEKVMRELYNKYSNRIVDTETASVTGRRKSLEDLFKKRDAEANVKGQERIVYLTSHYWQQSSQLSASMGKLEQMTTALANARMNLDDAKIRLGLIDQALSKEQPTIDRSVERVREIDNPAARLIPQKEALQTELNKLRQRYSDSHPAVQGVLKQIQAIDKQIEEAGKQPSKARETGGRTVTEVNPRYERLRELKTNFTLAVNGESRRMTMMERELQQQRARVQQMPKEDQAFQKIEHEYTLADNIRNNLRARLEAARIQEESDRTTQAQLLNLEVPPKAEKLDSAGKGILLYALGPLLGILIAFCFSLIAEALDHTLRTPVEVEKYLGKPVLAVIPRMQTPREERKRLGGASRQSISS